MKLIGQITVFIAAILGIIFMVMVGTMLFSATVEIYTGFDLVGLIRHTIQGGM